MQNLKVKKLHKDAQLPKRSYQFDAGLDLTCVETTFLPIGETIKVPTGIAINVPNGYYGQIHDRSGCAIKGLKVSGGVVDSGFLGELCVIITNLNNTNNSSYKGRGYLVNKGDRIAQIVFHKIELPEVIEVKEFEITERNTNGFNSTGR